MKKNILFDFLLPYFPVRTPSEEKLDNLSTININQYFFITMFNTCLEKLLNKFSLGEDKRSSRKSSVNWTSFKIHLMQHTLQQAIDIMVMTVEKICCILKMVFCHNIPCFIANFSMNIWNLCHDCDDAQFGCLNFQVLWLLEQQKSLLQSSSTFEFFQKDLLLNIRFELIAIN